MAERENRRKGRLAKALLSVISSALLVLPAPALAQEVAKAVPAVAPPAGNGAGGGAALAPLSPVAGLPASAGSPLVALAASPWNSAAPAATRLEAAPLLAPAAAVAAPGPRAAAKLAPVSAPDARAAQGPAAAADGAARVESGADAAPDSKLLQGAARVAAGLASDKTDPAELPPPADAIDSLAQASLEIDPARPSLASPADWRDETLYSVFLDRFNKSAGGKSYGDPKNGLTRHGGDIRGVTEKLDYIKASGVTTILLSPVTMTVPEAYHGYAPVHFLAVDPHLGTMADLKELVAQAHARGLRVVLDWVLNHSGPVFEYADGKTQWTGDGTAGPIEWTRTLKPVEFTQDDFTRQRVITNWNDPAQVTKADFAPNYRHFATDRPQTQDKLIHLAQWWIKETGVDGLRLDAVRHLAPGFLPRFSREIRAYTAKLGKKNFLLLGENSTGVDGEMKPYLEGGSLDTLYHYPAFRRENTALHGKAPTRVLENSQHESRSALGPASSRLVRFIDLHDTYRFLLSDTPIELLKTALAFVMTAAGIPIIYYGTEQAFRQLHGRLAPESGDLAADPQNREDMFGEGQYKSASSAGDKFDEGSASFKFLRALADLRKAYPALTRGEQYERWSDPNGPGIYAFSRIHEKQEVLVVLNTSGEPRSATMWVDPGLTSGAILEDAMNPDYRVASYAADGGEKVSVAIPPYGVRVLVRPAPAR